MSDGEKRDEVGTTEMAMDEKKEDSEGLEMPIAEDHAHPPDAEEQHENPPEVEKEEKNEPRAGDDHALATSVGSGEDDYESADEEAGQKLTDAPVAPATENTEKADTLPENTGSEPKVDDKRPENEEAASTSSKGSDRRVPGRRRRNEESEHEEGDDAASDSRTEGDDDHEADGGTDRESGDEEETPPPTTKADEAPEDRQNPTFVPRRGNFFQHDTRAVPEEPEKPAAKQSKKQMMMEKQNRWQHDMFDESEQTPKSRHELINSYGYDIRHESRAPRDPHGRRYGRSQNVERDWRDPDSYGRRSFGGYRRSFGAGGGGGGGGGRGRGRGGGGGGRGRDQQEPSSQGSRSVSPGRNDDGRTDNKRQNEGFKNNSNRGVPRSRSFSDGERGHEDRPHYVGRGGYRGGGYQRTYGTVEFRRRGRGTAFASNQRGAGGGGGGGRHFDAQQSRRSAEGDLDRQSYNDYPRGNRQMNSGGYQQRQSFQAPPRFQQHQGPRRGAPYAGNASTRRSREYDQNESIDSSFDNHPPESQQHQHQQPFGNARQQQQRNQDRGHGGAATKRYSAIRQQTHPQPPVGPSAPTASPQSNLPTSVQQGGAIPTVPLVMPQGPQPNVAPVAMMAPPPGLEQTTPYPPNVPYPPYYNGSGMYAQAASVPVPEMYPVPGTFADRSASYVLPTAPPHGRVPQAFIGQQQYPPGAYAMNQPMPHYSAESRDAYAPSGGGGGGGGSGSGGGGTVYFDPGSQQQRPPMYSAAPETKRRLKSIPIVSPEQASATAVKEGRTMGDQ